MAEQAWGQNAIIVQDTGFSIRWRPKCPYCGYVPTNRTNGGTAQKGIRASYHDRYDKCGKSIDVVISRG